MSNKRIACILLDTFSLEMFYQKEPSLAAQPFVLIEGRHKTAPIVAMNQPATEYGVLIGGTATQAHVTCPDLIVKLRDTEKEQHESQKLLKALRTIGPFVENGTYIKSIAGALGIFLEVSGLLRLHQNETTIAEKIIAVVTALGYPVKVGIGDNKFIAKVAAETAKVDRHTIVNQNSADTFIRDLDIGQLQLSSDTLETLRNLGLKKIGRLAEFPSNEMAQRFGHEGATLSHLSRGDDRQQFVRICPGMDLSNKMHLTYRIYNTAAIVNHSSKLLTPLLTHLKHSGQGCSRLELTLSLDNLHEEIVVASTEKPTLSLKKLTRQLHSQLEHLQLTSGVTDLAVLIPQNATAPLPSRQLGFDHRHKHRKGGSLEKNTVLPGRNLYTVTLSPALLPEQNYCLSPIDDTQRTTSGSSDNISTPATVAYCNHSIGGLRLFPAPIKAEAIIRNGRLSAIRHGHGIIQKVDQWFGPWRLSGGWWQSGFDRLYYELHTDDQRQYLFFFDRTCSQWFLQGVFD